MVARELEGTRLVIFDLDGTLVDSAEDIALSVNELLGELGRSPLPVEQLRGYIGNGVRKLLERTLAATASSPGLPGEGELDGAVARYLPIYRRRLLDHTRAYPGVEEALRTLGRERALAVLTNKPRRESVMILEGLALYRHFRAVYGGDSFAERKPHPMGVHHLLDELGCTAAETLFVGDSAVDVRTARSASVRSCLVAYGIGYADAKDLEPDLVVQDLRELARAVVAR